jgi:hypothetical protein
MAKYAQGKFSIKNPEKYVGKKIPTYRSGWEFAFMQFCDNNDNVVKWASEAIRIPYKNPLTGKQTMYVPDFFVQYRTKNNKLMSEIVEIKPKKQSLIEARASARDRAAVAVNYAKWDAASKWCKHQGLVFRVITEDDIFHQGSKR